MVRSYQNANTLFTLRPELLLRPLMLHRISSGLMLQMLKLPLPRFLRYSNNVSAVCRKRPTLPRRGVFFPSGTFDSIPIVMAFANDNM